MSEQSITAPVSEAAGLNRRDFLKMSAVLAGAAILGDSLPAFASTGELEAQATRTQRIAGQERMETARAISQAWYPEPNSAIGVVIATKGKYPNTINSSPDAIISSPLSRGRIPILLNPPDKLTVENKNEILRVAGQNPSREALLLGGDDALSEYIAQELRDMLFDVFRSAGTDRYSTAVDAAKDAFSYSDNHYAMLASGRDEDFADALVACAAGSMTWRAGEDIDHMDEAPVLLTDGPNLPEDTKKYLAEKSKDPDFKVYTIGALATHAYPKRYKAITGPPAEMSVEVAKEFTENLDGSEKYPVGLATYRKCWDALGATAFIASQGGKMLYIHGDYIDEPAEDFLRAHRKNITKGVIFGGTAVISSSTQQKIESILAA